MAECWVPTKSACRKILHTILLFSFIFDPGGRVLRDGSFWASQDSAAPHTSCISNGVRQQSDVMLWLYLQSPCWQQTAPKELCFNFFPSCWRKAFRKPSYMWMSACFLPAFSSEVDGHVVQSRAPTDKHNWVESLCLNGPCPYGGLCILIFHCITVPLWQVES